VTVPDGGPENVGAAVARAAEAVESETLRRYAATAGQVEAGLCCTTAEYGSALLAKVVADRRPNLHDSDVEFAAPIDRGRSRRVGW
jgi:hypothetical protein